MNAAEFNALYEVGVPVFAYPGARPEDIPSARRLVTRTRSKAQPAGLDREGVVWVDGHGAYIALTHVDVVSEEAWEAARAVQRVAAMNDDVTSRDTLPAWLYQRFAVIHGCPPWDTLGDDERAYWLHQAAAVQQAVARDGFKGNDVARATSYVADEVVEYGVRVPGSAWPEDGVLLDGDTFDRADQEARLGRCRGSWPNAELVQRSVHRGEWTEATS